MYVCVCVGGVLGATHHGNLYGISVGVGQVTENEERAVFSQGLCNREVLQLPTHVLHSCALSKHTHTQIHTHNMIRDEN